MKAGLLKLSVHFVDSSTGKSLLPLQLLVVYITLHKCLGTHNFLNLISFVSFLNIVGFPVFLSLMILRLTGNISMCREQLDLSFFILLHLVLYIFACKVCFLKSTNNWILFFNSRNKSVSFNCNVKTIYIKSFC